MDAAVIILAIFIVSLVIIMTERVNETAMVLFAMSLAGAVLFLSGLSTFDTLIIGIEWDTILFVTAMMIIVSVAGSSGVFQYIALIMTRRTGGSPRRVYLVFMVFVYVISLFFDPLPTMLIMGSFTVEVCRVLEMDFRPILVSEVIVANFASIPSIVGSVPNIVIAIEAGLDPGYIFITLFPLSLILFIVTVVLLLQYYEGRLVDWSQCCEVNELFMINPAVMIRSRFDFYMSVAAMAVLILGLTIGPGFQIEASLVAMIIATGMLLFSEEDATKFLRRLSWDTIFFLVGLFGLIAAMKISGVIDLLVAGTTAIVGNNVFIAIVFMIWIPGLALAVIDNIPVAALLTPLAGRLGSINTIVPYTLLVGVNVGGYIIPFGDAPNMIAIDLAQKEQKPLSFIEFTKVALPMGLIHLLIATAYSFFLAIPFL
jgi:Na+/H+ antiporter NhaD/arsenite permease-like protein